MWVFFIVLFLDVGSKATGEEMSYPRAPAPYPTEKKAGGPPPPGPQYQPYPGQPQQAQYPGQPMVPPPSGQPPPAGPPPAYSRYPAPPPQGYYPPQQQTVTYIQQQPMQAGAYDPGARFGAGATHNVPPPPPGVMPNAAQAAASQGQPVFMQQQKGDWVSGGPGGGYTFW